jgi:hypothetical protein
VSEVLELGPGLVTSAGVNLLAADHASATGALKLARFHDFGLGTASPTIANTGLANPATAIRSGRAPGTQFNPVPGQYFTSGVMVFSGAGLITEWGLFTDMVGGVLFDRRTWAGTTVTLDSAIEARYTLTINAGG